MLGHSTPQPELTALGAIKDVALERMRLLDIARRMGEVRGIDALDGVSDTLQQWYRLKKRKAA